MSSEMPDAQQNLQNLDLEISPINTPKPSPMKNFECKRQSPPDPEATDSSRPDFKRQKLDEAQVHQLSEELPYTKHEYEMKPADFRNKEVRGFVMRGFDRKIFESIKTCSPYVLSYQNKTNSPIVICKKLEDLSRLIVLDGAHRVCSLISRSEDKKEENFKFIVHLYEAGEDFPNIWEHCVKLDKKQTGRANVAAFPPKMCILAEKTFKKELSNSQSEYSMSQQAVMLQFILERSVDEKAIDEVKMDLKKDQVSRLMKVYQVCADEGLVSSSTDDHSEKSPFFLFFMRSETKKIFTDNLDNVYKSNKCNLLILKASHVGDDETKDAIERYLDEENEQSDGEWLRNRLHEIIRKDKNDSDNFNIANINSLDSVPDSSIVMFQEKISEEHVKILKEKNCTVIILKPSTACGGSLLLEIPGDTRYAVLKSSVVYGKGPHIQPGEQVTCTCEKMLIQKLMTPENTVKRKLDMTIYQYIPE